MGCFSARESERLSILYKFTNDSFHFVTFVPFRG